MGSYAKQTNWYYFLHYSLPYFGRIWVAKLTASVSDLCTKRSTRRSIRTHEICPESQRPLQTITCKSYFVVFFRLA